MCIIKHACHLVWILMVVSLVYLYVLHFFLWRSIGMCILLLTYFGDSSMILLYFACAMGMVVVSFHGWYMCRVV